MGRVRAEAGSNQRHEAFLRLVACQCNAASDQARRNKFPYAENLFENDGGN